MVMRCSIDNKRCSSEQKKKAKYIIKCSKYQGKTEPIILL